MDNANYKQVSNYLANELGITREFVTKLIGDKVENFLKDAVANKVASWNFEQAIRDGLAQTINHGFKEHSTWRTTYGSFDEFVKGITKELLKEEIQKRLTVEFAPK